MISAHTENEMVVMGMAEYISREAAIDAVLDVYYDIPDIDLSGEKLEAAILNIPPADVTPVRHGRWDDSGRYRFPGGSIAVRCSECGCSLTASEYKLNKWNYCPVCGAKMDGECDA